jgi:hypothetical protein
MKTVARDPGTVGSSETRKLALLAVKLLVTGACFWYLWRQIDVSQVVSALALLDFRWVAFATVMVVLEIPLLALRWTNIVAALGERNERTTTTTLVAIHRHRAVFRADAAERSWRWSAHPAPGPARLRLVQRDGERGDRPCDRGECAHRAGIRHPAVAVGARGARRIATRCCGSMAGFCSLAGSVCCSRRSSRHSSPASVIPAGWRSWP